MTENFTIHLPKAAEKKLLARYDNMLQKAIEKALEDQELYKTYGSYGRLVPLVGYLNDNVHKMATWKVCPNGH